MSLFFIHSGHIALICLFVVFLYMRFCYICILYIVYTCLVYSPTAKCQKVCPSDDIHLQCRDTFLDTGVSLEERDYLLYSNTDLQTVLSM